MRPEITTKVRRGRNLTSKISGKYSDSSIMELLKRRRINIFFFNINSEVYYYRHQGVVCTKEEKNEHIDENLKASSNSTEKKKKSRCQNREDYIYFHIKHDIQCPQAVW